jgi:hypothetical protein
MLMVRFLLLKFEPIGLCSSQFLGEVWLGGAESCGGPGSGKTDLQADDLNNVR